MPESILPALLPGVVPAGNSATIFVSPLFAKLNCGGQDHVPSLSPYAHPQIVFQAVGISFHSIPPSTFK